LIGAAGMIDVDWSHRYDRRWYLRQKIINLLPSPPSSPSALWPRALRPQLNWSKII